MPGRALLRFLFDLTRLLIGAIALAGLGRGIMAFRYARLLPDLPMTVPWLYLAGMGFFWGGVLGVCAVGLFRLRPWSRPVTLVAATLYQAHVWLNHLLLDASDYALQTRPRDLLLSVLFLALVWGILYPPGIWRVLKPRRHEGTKAQRNSPKFSAPLW